MAINIAFRIKWEKVFEIFQVLEDSDNEFTDKRTHTDWKIEKTSSMAVKDLKAEKIVRRFVKIVRLSNI